MVESKKFLIIIATLSLFLLPRFLLTEVRRVIEELPVKSLPGGVGGWEAQEVLVCPRCLKELKEAVWQRKSPKNPKARMIYMENEVDGNSCPVHHLPLVKTKDVPVPFIVQKVLPRGTLFLRRWYRHQPSRHLSAADIMATIVISGANKRSIHRPERCLPAQGWQIVSRDRCSLPLALGSKRTLRVTSLVVRRVEHRKEIRQVAFYWFMSHRTLTGSNFKRLTCAWWDRVFRGLNYRWSYALLISPVRGSVDETTRRMAEFASQLLPLMYKGD